MSRCRPVFGATALLCLFPLLLLLLLAGTGRQIQAAPMTGELRCRCIEKVSKVIPPKHIANIELTPEGPHCPVSEVIATLKSKKEVCLDPSARWVKLIINRILKQVLAKCVDWDCRSPVNSERSTENGFGAAKEIAL